MAVNKYDIAHGIRSVATGLLVIGLLPVPFFFTGPANGGAMQNYFAGLMVLLVVIAVSQVFVRRYYNDRDTTNQRNRAEKIYGIIGLGLIGLFFVAVLTLWWISQK